MSIDHTEQAPAQHRAGSQPLAVTGRVRSGQRSLAEAALTITDQAGSQVARATSGRDGEFEFPAVRQGTYLVIAAVDGYQPHAEALTVESPLAGSLDIVLEQAAGVHGVVHDHHTGAPVVAAVVTAVSPVGEVLASTVSGPDGSYRIGGFEAEGLTLVAATATTAPVATVVEFDAAGTAPQRRVDLAIEAPCALGGTITVAGEAVAGLPLTLHDPAGRSVATTLTEEDGGYRFEGLKPDTYTLRSHTSAPQATAVCAEGSSADVALHPAG